MIYTQTRCMLFFFFFFFLQNNTFNLHGIAKCMRVGWKVPVDDSLTNGIQALQHWWKKNVDHKRDYVEKFGHIPWEYLVQPMNFSASMFGLHDKYDF